MIKSFIKTNIKYMITGLITLIPVIVSIFFIFYISGIMTSLFKFISSSNNPLFLWLSLFITFGILIGFGKKIQDNKNITFVKITESILSKFPLIDKLLSTLKSFTDMIQGKGKFEGLGVAKVPFAGGKTHGLITNVETLDNGKKEYTVFIVTGTFPPTGFVSYYMEDEIEFKENMNAQDVFQLQITLGMNSNTENIDKKETSN